MGRIPKRLIWTLKLALGIALLVVLVSRSDTGTLLGRLGAVDLRWLAAMFVIPHLGMLISAWKWQILLRSQGRVVPIGRLFALYMIGTFFNNFLPSMVGGDVVRAWQLGREQGDNAAIAAATFMERFTGLVALVLMLPLALLQPQVVGKYPLLVVPVAVVVAGLAGTLWLLFSGVRFRVPGLARMPALVQRGVGFLGRTREHIRAFRGHRVALLACFVISVAFYLGAALTVWLASRAVALELGFGFLVCVMPVVLFIGLIPVSVNGLGILESGYLLMLGTSGITSAEALSIALLIRARILFTAVLGGLQFLAYRHKVDPSVGAAGGSGVMEGPTARRT